MGDLEGGVNEEEQKWVSEAYIFFNVFREVMRNQIRILED
jgi:hypothetical protein